MRVMSCAALLALIFAGPVRGQETTPRAMTTDDGLDMVGVDDALISPDGSWVFYSTSELDWKENKRKKTFYMIPAAGGEAFQFIGEDGGSNFAFSPRGTYLAFTRPVDKIAQLFVMRTAGGEAVQLTKHKTAVGTYRWSDDETAIFFAADDAKSEEEEKEHKAGADAIFVDEGPNGQTAASWRNLWRVDLADKQEKQLTTEPFRVGTFDISPDGRRAVLTARYENRRNQRNHSEIFVLDLVTLAKSRFTENRAPEGTVIWAPDNRRVAYTAPSDGEWELRLARIWILDVDTGERRAISDGFSGNVSNHVWTPDGQYLLFTGLQGTNSALYRVHTTSGAVERLSPDTGTLRAHAFSRDRSKMVYGFQDLRTPEDLFVSSTADFDPVRLTNANPEVTTRFALATSDVVRWTSRDGREIEGLLVLPADYEPGQRRPLLLHIHGGPAGVFTNSFRSAYHVWAGLGYVQILPNVRGSSGYTDELLRGNMQDLGGGDYWDLMTGVDYAIAQGYAHPDSLALRGWSYGGILGGWTITQTDRFRAASLGAMVSDWTSEYGPGFNHDVRLWYIGGTPWDNPDGYRQKSALTHIANVTTPTLLLHGINDRTDTEAQSMMFYAALKDQGKPVRYVRFPREPHGFREPRHQRTRDIEEIRWIQKYVRQMEWTPWERPATDEDEKTAKVTAGASSP